MRSKPLKLKISKNIFTKVYWELQNCHKRFVLNYGGAGSSKSYSQAQHEILKATTEHHKTLVIRKVGSTLKDSCESLIEDEVIKKLKLERFWKKLGRGSGSELQNLNNESKILYRGLDDPDKLKSAQGITRIWIEEADQLEKRDIDQINLRMRGSEKLQISMTFNPITEKHFLKKTFFDSQRDDVDFIHSTFKDNHFIDEAYKQQMEWYKINDPEYYRVYGLGNWGTIKSGYEFYKHFSNDLIKQVNYDPNIPLHISFDFNTQPYMTCLVFQVNGNTVKQIDEILTSTPKNNTSDICNEFRAKYASHNEELFVYGDPSGKAADTRTKEGQNDFSIIMRELSEMRPQRRVDDAAPSVTTRGKFINDIFAGKMDIKVIISGDCNYSIDDFRYVKEQGDGKKLKEKKKDKETGISFEKFGHTSDAFDYFICRCFKSEYEKYKGGGDLQDVILGNVEKNF